MRAAREIVAGVQDGSVDLGLVRCAPDAPGLERRTVRADRQGLLMRHDHRLADRRCGPAHRPRRRRPLLLHPREANPGHYDAVLALCREQDVEPHVVLRSLVFDLSQAPVVHGDAVAIVGESSCSRSARRARVAAAHTGPEPAASTSSHGATIARPRWVGCSTPRIAISGELGWV